MNINTDISLLAKNIKAAIAQRNGGRKEWIEGTFKLGLHLLEARIRFIDHNEFGDWLKKNGVELNHQDRAALIEMAKNPKRFRKVLEATERWSIRLIYEEEFKPQPDPFTSAGKRVEPEPTKTESAGGFTHVSKPPTKASKKSAARVDYDKRLSEAKAEIRDKAKDDIEARVKAQVEAHKAKLEREYQQKKDELSKLTKRAMLRLDSVHGLVEKDDDIAIIKCLHPDHVTPLGPEYVAMHEKGWRAYHKYRDYIIIKPPEK